MPMKKYAISYEYSDGQLYCEYAELTDDQAGQVRARLQKVHSWGDIQNLEIEPYSEPRFLSHEQLSKELDMSVGFYEEIQAEANARTAN